MNCIESTHTSKTTIIESPAEYYSRIPFEQHPEDCPCLWHQIDGDALPKEWDEAARAEEAARAKEAARAEEVDRAEEAARPYWRDEETERLRIGYGMLYESEQLTRDLILAYLPTRGEWASAHSRVTSLTMRTALWIAPALAQAAATDKKNRIELDHRADSVRLCCYRDTRRDYVDNWSLWHDYLDEKEKLLVPGGPVSGLVLKVWRTVKLTEETANLYQEFYDLEHARQCHISCKSSRETDVSTWLDPACGEVLERLRATRTETKVMHAEINKMATITLDRCIEATNPAPNWLGGVVAPELNERAPDNDPLWIL